MPRPRNDPLGPIVSIGGMNGVVEVGVGGVDVGFPPPPPGTDVTLAEQSADPVLDAASVTFTVAYSTPVEGYVAVTELLVLPATCDPDQR